MDQEAALLAAKEKWANQAGEIIVAMRVHPRMDLEVAVAAARAASLWADGFKELREAGNIGGIEHSLEQARESAVEKSKGLLRYPSGVLTALSILAMNEAFVLTFDPSERELARELLDATA